MFLLNSHEERDSRKIIHTNNLIKRQATHATIQSNEFLPYFNTVVRTVI